MNFNAISLCCVNALRYTKNLMVKYKPFISVGVLILIHFSLPLLLGFGCFYHNYLLFVTLITLLGFIFITQDPLKSSLMDGNGLGVWFGHLGDILLNLGTMTPMTDPYTNLLMYIGLAMVTLDTLFNHNTNSSSLLDKLKNMWYNKGIFFLFFLFIYIINIGLIIYGLGIILSTTNRISFIHTMFSKVILIRLIIILSMFITTGTLKPANFFLSLESIIVIICLGYVNIFYVTPFIWLTLVETSFLLNIFSVKHILFLVTSNLKYIDLRLLGIGFTNILKAHPLTSKLSDIIEVYCYKSYLDRCSPFRIPYRNFSMVKRVVYMIPRISAYVPLNLPKILTSTDLLYYSLHTKYDLSVVSNIFKLHMKSLTRQLHDLFTLPVNCRITLKCNDSLVVVKASIGGGRLEEVSMGVSSMGSESNHNHSFISKKALNNMPYRDQLLYVTDPLNTGYINNPVVYMQQDYSYDLLEDETSPNKQLVESSFDKGKKRALEYDVGESWLSQDTPLVGVKYSSIAAELLPEGSEYKLHLDYNDQDLLNINDYLTEITIKCRMAITEVLSAGYVFSSDDITYYLENFKLENFVMDESKFIKYSVAFSQKHGLPYSGMNTINILSEKYLEGNELSDSGQELSTTSEEGPASVNTDESFIITKSDITRDSWNFNSVYTKIYNMMEAEKITGTDNINSLEFENSEVKTAFIYIIKPRCYNFSHASHISRVIKIIRENSIVPYEDKIKASDFTEYRLNFSVYDQLAKAVKLFRDTNANTRYLVYESEKVKTDFHRTLRNLDLIDRTGDIRLSKLMSKIAPNVVIQTNNPNCE